MSKLRRLVERVIREEYYKYEVGKPVRLSLNASNPKLYGLSTSEFAKLQKYDNQIAIVTKIDTSDPEEYFYDLKFKDGYLVSDLSHHNLTKP